MYTRWLLVCFSAACELWNRYGYPVVTNYIQTTTLHAPTASQATDTEHKAKPYAY